MTSIYDDLANSDYVNPGQFKEQLKMMSNVKDSLDSQEENLFAYPQDPNQQLKQKLKSELPGQMYQQDSFKNNEDYLYFQKHLQNPAQNQDSQFEDENNFGNNSLEQLKIQNIIGNLNPMDNENEQSLLRNQQIKYQQNNQKGAKYQDQNILIQAQNEFVKQKNEEFIKQQASDEKQQFQMKTQMRQQINEEDLLENYQPWPKDKKTYDQLVEQRNRMIFEDNIDAQDYIQQNLDSHNYDPVQNEQNIKFELNQNFEQKKKDGDCHFTLNKYDSKSDLIKKVPVNHEEYDSQVQTAHFKKQAYGNPSQASDRARVNTEQTQRTNAGQSRQDQRQKQHLQDHLIDQQVFQEDFLQQNFQTHDIQNIRNFDDGDYNENQQDLTRGASSQQIQYQNEETGQFGKKQNVPYHAGQNNQINSKINDSNRSPQIMNKLDNDNQKINQLLAQLQQPMNIGNNLADQNKDESYPMSQYDLEKAHQQMQQSIKQLKLVNKISKNGMYGEDDHDGSINNHMGGGGPKNFNGQNSLYELANKVGHPLSSSNLNSDNDVEFQKILQGDGSLGSGNNPYSMHKFGGISGNNMNYNPNDIVNLANSENEMKYKPISNNDRNHYLQNSELFYNNNSSLNANQDEVKNKQETLAHLNQRILGDRGESNQRGGVFRDAGELILKEKRQSSKNSNQITVVFEGQNNDNAMGMRSQSFNMQQPPQIQRYNGNQNQYIQDKKQMSLAQRANQAKLQNLNKQISEQNNFDNQFMVNQFQNKMDPYFNLNQNNQNFRQKFDPYLAVPGNENLQQENVYSTYNFQYQSSINQAQKQGLKQQQQKDFSSTIQNEKMMKRKALLMNIDDIPIHELHKADGYQIRQIDEDDISRGNQDTNYLSNNVGSTSRSPNRPSVLGNDGASSKLEDELKNISLSDKVFHKNWKVRMNAIKEINQIMIDFVKNGGLQKVLQKEEQIYGDSSNPFDVYGPIIDKMIKDSNLTAQYEGLLCLQTYIFNGDDIKTVTASCISFLLDKIQINKPNFKEITFNIIQMMIKRRQTILPELLKRYKSVNPRVISFCLENLNKSFEDKNLFLQEANLKMIYKYTTDLLAHNIKELRDQSLTLVTHVYENCQDDVQTFCSNIKGLRPIQIKELKETLKNHSKNLNSEYTVRLFDQTNFNEDKKEISPERSKSREKVRNYQQVEQKEEKVEEIDLCSILPENFSEIPRLNQIKQKQKAMEQFNQDLEKLRNKQLQLINQENGEHIIQENNNYFIKQKDYSNIFNIISSLLEDPNMLVFIEAIKTVEHLSALLKSNFKREKVKQFIQILADKYKESKTAVLTALEKSFDTIFENKCMPPNLFFDILVNQISFSHKNPRVKQMVLERVEIIIEKYYLNNDNVNDDFVQKNTNQITQILKQIKEKLQQIILKDTNASVRDQGVILISLIKSIMIKGGAAGLTVAQEIIDSLPKQRQSEIQKRIESYDIKYPNRDNIIDLPSQRENEKLPKSRGVSAKSGANSNRNPEKQSVEEEHRKVSPMKSVGQGAEQQILFNTKKAQSNVSSKYQASLSDVIMTIKNISQDRDRLRIAQIIENFEMAVDELADGGIKECKSQIIACIYWLLSNFPSKINFLENDRQEAIKAVLNFMKKLYCIDRQICINPSNGQGIPQELYQAVSSVLICYALFQNDQLYNKQLSQILNLIFVASTESGLSPQYFMNTLKQTFTKYDPCQKQLPKGKLIIISSTIYFISDRLEDILEKSKKMQTQIEANNNRDVDLKDFEEFRSVVIQQIEQGQKKQLQDEDKQLLIQSLVYLKEQMNQYTLKQNQNNFKEEIQEPQIVTFSGPRHLDVIQELQTNFETGLQKLKELVMDEVTGKAQPLLFEQKELILKELMQLATIGYSNPQEQYKQAYSLKALMWLKDELIGNEDTFKLTSFVMSLYSKACFEGKDSSIEQYLLNFWTKDLSLRDIVDRIQYTFKYELVEPDSSFSSLFQWILDNKLSESSKDQGKSKIIQNWVLEDFRKISFNIAQFMVQKNAKAPYHQSLINSYDEENIVHQRKTMILNFLDMCVDKFSAQKVRDFMEIQLIHENNLLLKFIDQFDNIYRNLMPQRNRNENEYMKIQKDNVEGQAQNQSHLDHKNKYNVGSGSLDEGLDSLGEPLLTNRSNMEDHESLMNSSVNQIANRSLLLQEKRDRRKEETLKNQKEILERRNKDNDEFEDTLAEEKKKYTQIMERLENFKSKKFQSSDNLEEQRKHMNSNENINLKNIDRQTFEIDNNPKSYDNNRLGYNQNENGYQKRPQSKGKGMDIEQRTGSERYKFQKNSVQDGQNSLQDFNDDEDFRLSTDNQQSLAMLGMIGNSQKSSLVNNHYVQSRRNNLGEGLKQKKSNEDGDGTLESSHNYLNAFDSGISGRQTIINDGKSNDNDQFSKRFDKNISKEEQYLQESRQKIKQSVQYQEEKLQRLESSQIKVRQIKNEVDTLNDEKRRLEEEKRTLLNEQNRESEEWKRRYNEMTRKNDEIISNLAEANRCYLRQCDENEKLSKQITDLQQQHKDFIQKYRALEEKLQVSEKQVEIQQQKLLEESQKNMDSPRSSNKQVIEEKNLQIVEQVFNKSQLVSVGQNENSSIGIAKIQELLLDSDGQNQNLSQSLIFHYQKLKQKQDRMQMLIALKQSLENEDVLFAVSNEVYKSLLNFLLKSFSFEKELIERESLHRQHERELQNELTQESQRLVSKLLNSKEFTQSLICMIQLLKNEAMPDDFSVNLSIQERQYLRVIMRCITRITKALHSENPELIRAFDVLIEMQKLFVRHPPENLRQDLPCLQDLDFVFRGLKDVSDKLILLQPQKCISFLEFCKQGKGQESNGAAQSVEGEDETSKSGNYSQVNAFIKYIDQMIQTKVYSSNL